MSDIRLHEGELNIMELLWSNKSIAAKDIAKIIKEYIGWTINGETSVVPWTDDISAGVILNEN